MTSRQKAINYIDGLFRAALTYRYNTVDMILNNIDANSTNFRRRALIPTPTWTRVLTDYRVGARRAYPNRLAVPDGEPIDSNRRP